MSQETTYATGRRKTSTARVYLSEGKGNILVNDIPLEEDLNNCRCVIAYNSNVALQATLLGIPVITGDISPCKPISFKLDDFNKSEKSLSDLFNKEPKNRLNLLYWLANNQWKLTEIENGIAWKMLKENENLIS